MTGKRQWSRDVLATDLMMYLLAYGARIYASLCARYLGTRCGIAYDRDAQSMLRAGGAWLLEETYELASALECGNGSEAAGEEAADCVGVFALSLFIQAPSNVQRAHWDVTLSTPMRPAVNYCPALLDMQAENISCRGNGRRSYDLTGRFGANPFFNGFVSKLDRNAVRSINALARF